MENVEKPWPALWSLVIGFFMILIDTTIVSVANPRIMEGLNADINSVIWVTSAYLLAYAVPLLITGRLGDRFGPKKLYLLGPGGLYPGLAVVRPGSGTWRPSSSPACCRASAPQLMTPQTMAVITRIFPPDRRGAAMAMWGATAGMATLVGPILGGVLVDSLGWEWIFFINVPVGIVGFILAVRNVPVTQAPTRTGSTSPVCCSAPSASSCWSSASRKARPTTGEPSPAPSASGG